MGIYEKASNEEMGTSSAAECRLGLRRSSSWNERGYPQDLVRA